MTTMTAQDTWKWYRRYMGWADADNVYTDDSLVHRVFMAGFDLGRQRGIDLTLDRIEKLRQEPIL